jgi:HK97 family phage portal protein
MRLFAQRSIDSFFGIEDGFGRTGFRRNEAGVRVTHDSVLTDDSVLAAVSLLAGDIAGLPMRAYVTDGHLTKPLARQPDWIDAPDPLDPAITDVAHKSQVALSVLLAGNAYVYCSPNIFNPVTLTVLNPVRVRVTKPGTERLFEVLARGSAFEDWTPRNIETLSSAQVLHIPYMLRPGRLEGLSPVDAQSGNFGISEALRRWLETFFGKGAQVQGFVSLPESASPEAVEDTAERINKRYGGWRKAGILGALGGGAKWEKTGLTPQDADLAGLWRRQLELAARVYGIPPFMIGSQEAAGVAYASAVERAQHYIDHCLMRYTRPIEKAYSRLVPGDGRLSVPHSNTEIRFNFDALLRGDPKARWESYKSGLEAKSRTIDEVRALENLPPMGDYTQEQLEGPGGLLQTPNNNGRPVAAGGQLEDLTGTASDVSGASPTPTGPTPPAPKPMQLIPGGLPK